jgi:hypothetical protein
MMDDILRVEKCYRLSQHAQIYSFLAHQITADRYYDMHALAICIVPFSSSFLSDINIFLSTSFSYIAKR